MGIIQRIFATPAPEARMLSELAEMFSEQEFRDRIAAATDAADVHRLFQSWVPEPQ